jgi:hypothetical protein
MDFCEHCEGQRFDRAQVLRRLREVRRQMRAAKCGKKVEDALTSALKAVAELDIPHLYFESEIDEVVH